MQEGTICLCEESHLLDIENDNVIANYELPESFLSNIFFNVFLKYIFFLKKIELLKNGSNWVYSDFQIGDLLIFNIKTIHCSFRFEIKKKYIFNILSKE